MKEFLIEKINGEIKHDFSFTLLRTIEYWNWRNHPIGYWACDKGDERSYMIPIGSIEFVLNYIKTFHPKTTMPVPKNIPNELILNFTGRDVFNGQKSDIQPGCFVKSNTEFKGICEIATEQNNYPEGSYQLSEKVEFLSEWRAFVFQEKLIGLHNYSGDFTLMPNVNTIRKMINAYSEQPVAFTLDVGILESNKSTVVIEVHDFFSCGLYGFNNPQLPFMFSQWFEKCINF